MTRLAKAMSAFTPGRSGSAEGRDARPFAGRGLSLGVDGSGASSAGRVQAIATGVGHKQTSVSTVACAVLSLAFILLFAPSANAQSIYGHVGQFGASGAGEGQFNGTNVPQRIEVHDESGKLFVADRGNHRIQVFTPTPAGAAFDFAFGGSTIINHPIGVAIDQDTGDVYVTAAGSTQAVVKFNPDDPVNPGAYTVDATFTSPAHGMGPGQIGAFQANTGSFPNRGGIAVDPTSGEILVADPGKNLIQRFDSDGAHLDQFNGCSPETIPGLCSGTDRAAFTRLFDLAVTSTGDVITADLNAAGTLGRIDRFSGDGTLEATLSQNNNPVPNTVPGGQGMALVVAVNRSTDEVFASSVTATFIAPQPARVYQFVADEHVDDFTAPANFILPFGMASGGPEPARFYAVAGDSVAGGVPRVQVFEAVVPPTVSEVTVSDVTATEATFSGTVNPQGSPTNWSFEYRPVGTTDWLRVPDPPESAGDDTEDVAVQATASELEPNTEYEVRLRASGPGIDTFSEQPHPVFTTDSAPPSVTTVDAGFISESSARLVGWVNPRNTDTSYHFEWGTDTTYGEVVPVPEGQAGDGGVRLIVYGELSELEPGTTYHFRLVAENEAGQVGLGTDRSFTTSPVAPGGLQGERGWEVVGHLPTGGQDLTHIVVGEKNDVVQYGWHDFTLHIPGIDLRHRRFLATRGPNGWSSEPADMPNPAENYQGRGSAPGIAFPADFSRILTLTTLGIDPDDQNEALDLYMREPDGSFSWVSRAEDAVLDEPGEPQVDGAVVERAGMPYMSALSSDGRTVVLRTARRLLEADPHPSDNSPFPQGSMRLYKWTDGELSLVSVRPNGSVATGVPVRLGGNVVSQENFSRNAVSRDGTRVFWGDSSALYVNVDGRDPVEMGPGAYSGATPDGSRAVFHNAGRLHSYEVDAEISRDLTGPAGVQGVAAFADEGNRVYFVATASLDSEPSPLGKTPTAGGNNLYLVDLDEDGLATRTRFIATLGAGGQNNDGNVWSLQGASKVPSTTPNGDMLVLGSVASLTGEPTGGNRQAYLYDYDANSLVCVSCPADGSPVAQGHVNSEFQTHGDIPEPAGTPGWASQYAYVHLLTPDGAVFFSTPTALVPEDENQVRDVYEYRHGEVRLLSRGGWDDAPSALLGATPDGETAYFLTREALDPADNEPGLRKLYAARIGGGFVHSTPPPACVGDECQEAAAPAPSFDRPASSGAGRSERTIGLRAERCAELLGVARRLTTRARRLAGQARRLVLQTRRALARGTVGAKPRARHGAKRLRTVRRAVQEARRGARQARNRAAACSGRDR